MTESTSGTPNIPVLRIALIGYGEVGTIFGRALARGGALHVAAYDTLLADARRSAPMREHAAADRVRLAVTAAGAVGRHRCHDTGFDVTTTGRRDEHAAVRFGGGRRGIDVEQERMPRTNEAK